MSRSTTRRLSTRQRRELTQSRCGVVLMLAVLVAALAFFTIAAAPTGALVGFGVLAFAVSTIVGAMAVVVAYDA